MTTTYLTYRNAIILSNRNGTYSINGEGTYSSLRAACYAIDSALVAIDAVIASL